MLLCISTKNIYEHLAKNEQVFVSISLMNHTKPTRILRATMSMIEYELNALFTAKKEDINES